MKQPSDEKALTVIPPKNIKNYQKMVQEVDEECEVSECDVSVVFPDKSTSQNYPSCISEYSKTVCASVVSSGSKRR